MQYRNRVLDFFEPYANEVDSNNSIMTQIEEAGDIINRFFREDVIDYTIPVRNIVIIGKAIESIHEFPVVKPDGSHRKEPAEKIYSKKLLTEENPWKTIYELEVAQSCRSAGLDTKLVHEGQDSGPDILVYSGGERIDIECKRRDTYPSDKEYDYEEIRKEIINRVEVGEDSFFIELTADGPLEEQAIQSVIDLAVKVIENRNSEMEYKINNIKYKVILKDYYEGERRMDISKQDVERWFENEIISPYTIQKFLSPFDQDKISHGSFVKTLFKFTKEGKTISKKGAVFDFNFPSIDDKYYNRIVNTTLSSGRKDLKNRSPAVLFLHLPAYETEDMVRYNVQEESYDPIPQIQRLEQRIEGELKQSSSVNAVVLNTSYFSTKGNNCHLERGFRVFQNPSPDDLLPKEFKRYLAGELFNQ